MASVIINPAAVRHPVRWAAVGSTLIALGSFGAGATRNRGGVISALGIEEISYGHAAGFSNLVLWIGILLVLASWVIVGRVLSADRVKAYLIAAVTPLLFSMPILSRDVYSYLMQGAMMRDGFDPYTQGAAVNPGPYLLEVSYDWRNTTTPYGPLHLWIAEIITRLVGDNVALGVIAYKVVSVIGMVGIAWAIPRIASKLGADPVYATWIGVANPVMILHMVGGMHNESVMVGLTSIGLLLCLDRKFVAGIALISVAVSLKATAAVALPFVVWMAFHHVCPGALTREVPIGRQVVRFVAVGAGAVAEALAVVALVTVASGSSWGWLSEISGNSKVINPLAAPSFLAGMVTPFIQLFNPDFNYNVPLGIFRTICSVLMLVGLVATWLYFRKDDRDAFRGIITAYAVAFLFNSVTLPWYYASIISLIGTVNPSSKVRTFTITASVVLAFAFTGSGNHQLYNVGWLVTTAFIGIGCAQFVSGRWKEPATTRAVVVDKGNDPAKGSATAATEPSPARA